MKKLHFCVIILFLFVSTKTNGFSLIFETGEVIIKIDTNDFFIIIDKQYSLKRAAEIRNEIQFRSKASNLDNVKMDGMNLNIYKDSTRRSYEGACLYNYIIFELIDRKKSRIFYKSDLSEIVSFKTSKIGNIKSGRIERLYIDNKTGTVFLKRILYVHRRVCSGPPDGE